MALEPVLGVIADVISAFASFVSEHPALAAITTIVTALGILVGACMALAPVFVTLSSIAGILGVSIGAVASCISSRWSDSRIGDHCWIDYLDAKFMANQ